MVFIVALFMLYGGVYVLNTIATEAAVTRNAANATEEVAWVAKGCPIYKSQCGSKHPYACEQKAAVIGRNRIGDTFVEAYGSCVSK